MSRQAFAALLLAFLQPTPLANRNAILWDRDNVVTKASGQRRWRR